MRRLTRGETSYLRYGMIRGKDQYDQYVKRSGEASGAQLLLQTWNRDQRGQTIIPYTSLAPRLEEDLYHPSKFKFLGLA